MKKLTFLLLVFLIANGLSAADEVKPVSSTIKKVTVFKKGAQVTREAQVSIPAGTSQLKFIRISPDIDKNSIQVKADGNFTLLSVQHQLNYLEIPGQSDSILQLTNQQKNLTIQVNETKALVEVYKQEESLILTNKSIGGQQNGVSIKELEAAANFYRVRLKELKLETLKLNRSIAKLRLERDKITKQITVLKSKKGTYSSEVILTVNAQTASSANFSLNYAISNAGWYPTYDLRVKDIVSPVMLTYKANVYQTSGEDWKDVKLTLSTGNPSQSGLKPELQPWRLGFYTPSYASYGVQQRYNSGAYGGVNQLGVNVVSGKITDQYGEPLIGASILIKGTTQGTVADLEGNYSISLPNNASELIISYTGFSSIETQITSSNMNIVMEEGASLDEVVVMGYNTGSNSRSKRKKDRKKKLEAYKPVATTTTQNTTTVEFEIETPYSILTDGKQNIVNINEHGLNASYEYYCSPKLDLDAFLTAQVTDWEKYHLLNGEANLFFEGTFVGKSFLDVLNTEDTLDISLGRDKDIIVKRTRKEEFSKKQFISNKKTDSRGWEISIRNKKTQAVKLVIEDQIPISTTQEIEVKHELSEGGKLEKDTGFIEWDIQLAAGGSEEVDFQYSVKYPKKKRVILE